jgi:hypothetical protein
MIIQFFLLLKVYVFIELLQDCCKRDSSRIDGIFFSL